MVYVIAWIVWFALYLVWIFGQYFVFKPGTPLVLSVWYFLSLMFMFPMSENVYAYFRDSDPWNTAPYMQWYCFELRFMTLTLMGLYLLTVVAERWWPPGSGARKAIKWISCVPFILFFVLAGIVVGDKVNPFLPKDRPYEAFTYLLDWTWVVVSLAATFISAGILMWFQLGSGPDNGEYQPRGSKLHAYAGLFLNMWLFIGTLVYAISNIVYRDDYDGSKEYYFQQEKWITRWAPYYTFIYVILSYFFMLGFMLMLMRAYNSEEYGTKYPKAWPERSIRGRNDRRTRR